MPYRIIFIAEHRRAEALARVFRILLYLASVLLLIYLGYLLARFGQALLQRSEAFNRWRPARRATARSSTRRPSSSRASRRTAG